MARLSRPVLSATAALLASAALSAMWDSTACAADMTEALDARHKACLERIAEDQDLALEEAMIWRDQGGARRARHCEAMALFALGHEGEAAHRLDALASGRDGGSDEMRANFRSEAANFWLAAEEPGRALASATAGLDHDAASAPLRIARARAHVALGDVPAAEAELDRVLKDHPGQAEALRYRADARLRRGRLHSAKQDIEASLEAAPDSVETALLRGRINEAIRLFDATRSASDAAVEAKPARE
ncbi:MAG: tetratricopeptide repeat protein [Pseudomonadota bacterium]